MDTIFLTIEQQITILEKTLNQLKEGRYLGLCIVVKNNIKEYLQLECSVTNIDIGKYIPSFTYENASKVNSNNLNIIYSEEDSDKQFWWPILDLQSRILYLEYLINTLKE
jgi:hypothetical protein